MVIEDRRQKPKIRFIDLNEGDIFEDIGIYIKIGSNSGFNINTHRIDSFKATEEVKKLDAKIVIS